MVDFDLFLINIITGLLFCDTKVTIKLLFFLGGGVSTECRPLYLFPDQNCL